MKVIISEFIEPSSINILKQNNFNVIYDPNLFKDDERLRNELKTASALIVRNQTKVDRCLIEYSDKLKTIGRLGVGLDNIDLKAADDNGLSIVLAKNANANSVAEYVLSAMLTCYRSLEIASKDTRCGNWSRTDHIGGEVHGKTLGLIGVGEIGHRVALRAKAFGIKVIGYDPFIAPFDFQISETGIELYPINSILEQSDFISIHVPLSEFTNNLIDKYYLSKMKPNSCIINTSRGGVINEEDLAFSLENGPVSFAFLDVLKQEPPDKDNILLKLKNCNITPHISGLTVESQRRISELIVNEVITELDGSRSICRIN